MILKAPACHIAGAFFDGWGRSYSGRSHATQVPPHFRRDRRGGLADVCERSDGPRARPPRCVAAYRRKCRQLRHVVDELSSAATSDVKADMVHLGGQVSV
jgi:hypothetical protein